MTTLYRFCTRDVSWRSKLPHSSSILMWPRACSSQYGTYSTRLDVPVVHRQKTTLFDHEHVALQEESLSFGTCFHRDDLNLLHQKVSLWKLGQVPATHRVRCRTIIIIGITRHGNISEHSSTRNARTSGMGSRSTTTAAWQSARTPSRSHPHPP